MEHARRAGFPAPRAEALSDTEMVLERIDGPTMVDDLARRPWRLVAHARTLASLHRRLHAPAAPAWLEAPFGRGDALVHLDPANVLLGARGPVVIDWPNARRGPAEADVAMTWIILATSDLPEVPRRALLSILRGAFVSVFLRHFDLGAMRRVLPAVAERRLADRNVRERERARVRLLARL